MVYDFRTLSPFDFELLARDLLQADLRVKLESFTAGRDRGIDLRCARITGHPWIVQCKHYVDSGFAKLRHHLEHVERKKIGALKPGRYFLVTSCPLTPDRKDTLRDLLSPWLKDTGDIVGPEDLNNLLAQHPQVERHHFKLWITGTAVLNQMLHSGIFTRTEADLESIRRRIALFVPTATFQRAREFLEQHHYAILAGVPGVGKTMLAEALTTAYVEQGFTPISIASSIADAWTTYRPTQRQVFMYDDFLGQTSLEEKLGPKEDQSLLRFLATVRTNPNTRLVLTTREYILAQARQLYEPLARQLPHEPIYIVKVEDLTLAEKAKILANHLYHHRVPVEFIIALSTQQQFRRITTHQNFNPRLIEGMTKRATQTGSPSDYVNAFLKTLDDPVELWSHPFENQLTSPARALLAVRATFRGDIGLADLEHAFQVVENAPSPLEGSHRFQQALKELDGSFVRTTRGRVLLNNEITVCRFANPSVEDFLRNYLIRRPSLLLDLARGARFFDQVLRLGRLLVASAQTGVTEDLSIFWRIVDGSWHWPDAEVRTLGTESQGILARRAPLSLESRALSLFRLWRSWGIPASTEVVAKCCRDLLTHLLGDNAHDTSSLLAFLEQAGPHCGPLIDHRDLISGARHALLSSCGDVQGIAKCREFARIFPEAVTPRDIERLSNELISCYESDVQDAAENETNADDLRSLASTIEEVGSWLGVPVENETETLNERADEIEAEERRTPYVRDPSRDWRAPSDEDDSEVFGALLDACEQV